MFLLGMTGLQGKEKVFKPYMLDHVHEGCPTNSSCLPKTGRQYKRWLDFLKRKPTPGPVRTKALERFRRGHGIPLKIWSFPKGEKTEGLIHWDSPCQNHYQKGKKIQIALGMAKKF